NIDNSLDTEKLHRAASELVKVAHVATVDFACSPEARKRIADEVKAHNLDRVLIAACSPKLYLKEFQSMLESVDRMGCMVEMCNIREQCAWIHFDDRQAATAKAEDLLRMSHDRLVLQSQVEKVNVSQVNKFRCTGCGICESVCNFNAIHISPDKDYGGSRKAYVNVNACEGCGACVAACPTAALDQTCFSNVQIVSQIETFLKDAKMTFPKVVVFSCHWCSYTAADAAGLKRMAMDPHFVVIRTMCSARVDPEWVLKALSKGADGVLVLAGHPGRCHYEIGNLRTRKRMTLLHNYLDQMGFDPDRFAINYVDSEEVEGYVKSVNEYIGKVRKLGPNPIDSSAPVSPKRLEMPWLDIKPPKKWNEGLDL
ncbi:MAG: hydrogenase iron-sulfur subunit, partial [Methanomassiliicoccales archaeon]|nr:hydrogenase iron-sulfur subunit [Methanomassiliicoccales archaeon]